MQVKLTYGDEYVNNTQSLESYIESKMESAGVFGPEGVSRKVDKIAAAFGQLVNILAEKKILDEPEIKQIVEDYTHEISLV